MRFTKIRYIILINKISLKSVIFDEFTYIFRNAGGYKMKIKKIVYSILYFLLFFICTDSISGIVDKIEKSENQNIISEIYINCIIVLATMIAANLLYTKIFNVDIRDNKLLFYSLPFITVIFIILSSILLKMLLKTV